MPENRIEEEFTAIMVELATDNPRIPKILKIAMASQYFEDPETENIDTGLFTELARPTLEFYDIKKQADIDKVFIRALANAIEDMNHG